MISEMHVKFASGIHLETPATHHSQTCIKSEHIWQLVQNIATRGTQKQEYGNRQDGRIQ